MTLSDAYSAIVSTLEGASLTVYPGGAIYTNSSGDIAMPTDDAFITVMPITGTATLHWNRVVAEGARFQVTSLAKTESGALAQLDSADTALPLPPWRPGNLRRIGMLNGYHVYSRDFLRTY